ncbi:MAG: multiheme c-type cytochrome [Phycisphaerales bacterium]
MKSVSQRGFAWTTAWLTGTALTAAVIGLAAAGNAPATAPEMFETMEPHKPRLNATMMYMGNQACLGSGCHDGAAEKHSGQMIGDEFTLWKEGDPHAKAGKSLANSKSKKIAEALKIGDATTDARCVSCHGMPVEKKGPKFGKDALANAVGCESCHGASEKWLDPHKEKGWTDKQRETASAKDMETKWGLIDTRNLSVRADNCVGCHLQIEPDLIKAGHPALSFEMYFYNNYKYNPDWKIHWDEQPGDTQKAKLWAIGQLASAATAAKGSVPEQIAKVFAEGKAIVKASFGSDDAAAMYTEFKSKDLPKAKVVEAAKALAGKADGYKSGAENAQARNVITSGVEALVSACMAGGKMSKEVEDKAITAGEAAEAGGDSWVKAVAALADLAK